MTQLRIDQVTPEILASSREPVLIVDAGGRVIGTFQPSPSPPYDTSLIPPTPLAELQRRAAEGQGRQLNEFLSEIGR